MTTGSLALQINQRSKGKKNAFGGPIKEIGPIEIPPLAATIRLSSCRVNTLPRVQVKGAPLYLLVFIGPRLHLITIAIHPSLLLEALREPGAHL